MTQPPPARPGQSVDEVDTPALLLDLDVFEDNLDRMAALLAGTGVRLRAHAKTHKSPVIAHLQMARGAIGQCVQKVGEAEALAWGGIADILVSNEVVGEAKLARLVALARICRIAVCCDDAAQIPVLDRAAAAAGVSLRVLVEIDVGHGRCGVEPGEPAVGLASAIHASPNLQFGGLQAYQGNAQHLRTTASRASAIAAAIAGVDRTMAGLAAKRIDCPVVGGGGTGTFMLEANSGVFTEIQAGSYCFMDSDYASNGDPPEFRQSLFVLSSVMSATRSGTAVIDAGLKALSTDSGFPVVAGDCGWRYTGISDEHGTITGTGNASALRVGDKIQLIRRIATRRSIDTTGMSASAAAGSSVFGPWPRAAPFSDRQPAISGGGRSPGISPGSSSPGISSGIGGKSGPGGGDSVPGNSGGRIGGKSLIESSSTLT